MRSFSALKVSRRYDPTVYPVDDEMGENSLELFIREVLRPLVERYLAERGTPQFVGGNQFIYWEQHNPTLCLAPDLYVLPNVPPEAEPECIKVWEFPAPPSFALEVVSRNKKKDYDRAPLRYEELGVQELIIFDPKAPKRKDSIRWQVYRRVARRGWVRVEATQGDRVRSKVLGCWLRTSPDGASLRLRLGVGPEGATLVPTERERRLKAEAEAQRQLEARVKAEAEAQRQLEARAKAEAEAQRQLEARTQAEAELARLRATLRKRGRRALSIGNVSLAKGSRRGHYGKSLSRRGAACDARLPMTHTRHVVRLRKNQDAVTTRSAPGEAGTDAGRATPFR